MQPKFQWISYRLLVALHASLALLESCPHHINKSRLACWMMRGTWPSHLIIQADSQCPDIWVEAILCWLVTSWSPTWLLIHEWAKPRSIPLALFSAYSKFPFLWRLVHLPRATSGSKSWVPILHRLHRPLFSLFSGGISHLSLAASLLVTHNLF